MAGKTQLSLSLLSSIIYAAAQRCLSFLLRIQPYLRCLLRSEVFLPIHLIDFPDLKEAILPPDL